MSDNRQKDPWWALFIPVVVIVLWIVFIFIAANLANKRDAHSIRYDCRLAEISPDFPTEVREACRKMRAQRGRI